MGETDIGALRVFLVRLCIKSKIGVSEAEAIAQEVLFRLVKKKGRVKNIKAWAGTCAFNLIRGRYRDWKAFNKHACHIYLAKKEATDPLEELSKSEAKEAMRRMIKSLSPGQKTVIEKWLQKSRDDEFNHMSAKERASLHRALGVIRSRFPSAKDLFSD